MMWGWLWIVIIAFNAWKCDKLRMWSFNLEFFFVCVDFCCWLDEVFKNLIGFCWEYLIIFEVYCWFLLKSLGYDAYALQKLHRTYDFGQIRFKVASFKLLLPLVAQKTPLLFIQRFKVSQNTQLWPSLVNSRTENTTLSNYVTKELIEVTFGQKSYAVHHFGNN